MGSKPAKISGPDIIDAGANILNFEGNSSFFFEIDLKEMLADRFLPRVSGQWKVGEENEGCHHRANHSRWKGLVVMHELCELGVRIREINLSWSRSAP